MKNYPLIIDKDTLKEENHNLIKAVTFMVPDRSRVLDIGTNSGWLLEELIAKKHCICTGVEVSRLPYEIAKSKGLDVVLADAQEMPFKDASFDVITMVDVLQQMNKQEARNTLKECYRVLTEQGVILGANPTPEGGWGIKNLNNSPYVKSIWEGHLFTRSINLSADNYLFVELREDIEKLIGAI